MENLKIRLLSLAIMMVMLISAIPVYADATTDGTEQTWLPMEVKYDIINQLGIVSDEQWVLNLDENVTRAEFAVYMQKLANLSEAESDYTLRDVMSETVEEKAIYAVYNTGIMEAVAQGYFYPAYAITQKDAVKAVTKVLGYPEVELKGLSPYDYANKIGLTEGVSAVNERLTRRDVFKIIYNALFAELLDMSYTGNGVENVTISENTYFALRYDAKHIEGIVTAVGKVVLGNIDSSVRDNSIIVGNTTLKLTEPAVVADLIGRNVTCYYDDDYNVLAIYEKNNEVTVLDADDDYQYKDGTYFVYDGNKEKKIHLDSPQVLLNDEEYIGDFTDSVMSPESGKAILIDNDKDGKAEIVLLYKYEYLIVYAANEETRQLKDVTKGLVDFSGYEEVVVYNEKGKIGSLNNLALYDVVKVAAGRKTVIITKCGTKSKDGICDGQRTDSEGRTCYKIGDTDYYLSAYALDALENGKLSPVKSGQKYTFYFNDESEIVYFKAAQNGGQRHYGVITGLKKPGIFGGHDEEDDVVIFSSFDNGFKSYPLAKSVTVNNSKGLKHADVYTQMSRLGKTGVQESAFIPQAIVWGTNSKGEINYIEQASARGDGTDGFFEFFAIPDSKLMTELSGSSQYSSSLHGWNEILQGTHPDGPLDLYTDMQGKVFTCGYNATATEVITAPYRYDRETQTFRIASDKTELFKAKSAFTVGGETADMIVYKDSASDTVASFVIKCVSATQSQNCGKTSTSTVFHMVKSISTEIKDDKECYKLVLANDQEIFADKSKFDFDNLPIYDASTGETTGKTHCLKPGNIVIFMADPLGMLQAIEPIYDHENKVFLGGRVAETNYRYYGSRSPYAVQRYVLYDTHDAGFLRVIKVNHDVEDIIANKKVESMYTILNKNAYIYREAEGRAPAVVEIAGDADLVGYADSKTEYVDIVAPMAGLGMGDYYFVYKHN